MTHDHSSEDIDQTHTAEGDVGNSAPSASEAGKEHGADEHDGHDEHGDHGGHDDHGHGDDASEKSTLVPVTWRQLILPAVILLIVGILLIGPVSAAFAPKPASSSNTGSSGGTTQPTAAPTSAPGGAVTPQATSAQLPPTRTNPANTPTAVAQVQPTAPPPQPTATTVAAANPLDVAAAATRTAVAVLGEQGTVARAPVQMQFAGGQFTVDTVDSHLLPDWKPSGDPTHATWIADTFANHIIYLTYTDANAALFAQAKPGDTVKLTMDNGQIFEFQVTRAERATNGPPTSNGQFTVTTAMSQDHAGVTVILVGDPANDRAVVQADFTGNIQ